MFNLFSNLIEKSQNLQCVTIDQFHDDAMAIEVNGFWNWEAAIIKSCHICVFSCG